MPSAAERYAAARRRAQRERSSYGSFAAGYDFPLDTFQTEACEALESGKSVLVAAPTGAGKTIVGEFAVHLALEHGVKAFYTTPIKALSNQKYQDLLERYGEERVGLLTGDTSINPHADVLVMTTEVLRNMLYSGSRDLERLGYVVMDEVHYLADRFRGPVWEEVILHLPPEVRLISLSATVSNAEEFGQWLRQVRGATAVIVSEHRPVPLTQHMMVGKRLYDLYALPEREEGDGHLSDAEPTSATSAQPVLNSDLVNAIKKARRRAVGEQDDRKTASGAGGDGKGRGRHAGGRGQLRAPHQRQGGGFGMPSLRAPSRTTVVRSLEAASLLPAIVFVFSRAGCDQAVEELVSSGIDLTTEEEVEQIREIVDRHTAAIPAADAAVLGLRAWAYGLERGFAAHHAGLLPVLKETVEELFSKGLIKVIYATETLALGINMPARTVLLESLRKWNGSAHVDLTPGEYTQLTGRAGRRGIDSEGHAVVLARDTLEPQSVAALASRRTYPLVSAFRPSYNMAVNLLQRYSAPRVREILEASFAQFQADRSVVAVAAQARAARRRLDEVESSMSCHLGDFREYMRLRVRLSEAEADASRERRASERAENGRSMLTLRRGDVVVYRAGRRDRYAVVAEAGVDRLGQAFLTVVGEDAKLHTLSPETTPQGVNRMGHLRIADHIDLRRPRERDRLVGRLITAKQAGTIDKDRSPRRRKRTGAYQGAAGRAGAVQAHASAAASPASRVAAHREPHTVEEIRAAMRAHPCHACPDREEHARHARTWAKAEREAQRLNERIARRTGTIARGFDAVCEVLLTLGYLRRAGEASTEEAVLVVGDEDQAGSLTAQAAAQERTAHGTSTHATISGHSASTSGELKVTDSGKLLARIYAERDLLIAQCLMDGAWDGLPEEALAAAVSACIFEPRLNAPRAGLPVAPRSELGRALRRVQNISEYIAGIESLARRENSPGAEIGMAGMVQAWTSGANLADVLKDSEMTAGDFVRWMKQLLDVLSQLAALPIASAHAEHHSELATISQRAAQACLDADRSVVAWSGI